MLKELSGKKGFMRNNKGMMTIEACVIIPIIVFMTIMILWIGMLSYNRNAINSAVSVGLTLGASVPEKDNEEIAECVKNKTAELLTDRLVLVDNPEINVTVSYGTIKTEVTATMDSPPVPGMDVFKAEVWDLGQQKEIKRIRCSRLIRTFNRVGKIMEDGLSDTADMSDVGDASDFVE